MIVKESYIKLDKSIKNQEDVIEYLSIIAFENNLIKESIVDELKKREEEYPTSIGEKIAIPHAKTDKVLKSTVLLVRLDKEIEWGGEEVKLILCLLSREQESENHLNMLSQISRKMMHNSFKKILFNAKSKKEIEVELNNMEEIE